MKNFSSGIIWILVVFGSNSFARGQLFGPDVDLELIANSFAFADDDPPEVGYRLPNNTYPSHYDLELTTHIHLEDETLDEKFIFEGKVVITIDVVAESPAIVLHKRNLTIHNAVLKDSTGEEVQVWENGEDIRYNATYEFLLFLLDEPIPAGETCTLEISFKGSLIEDKRLLGFYRAAYMDENNKRRWFATTQFESTSAREAFPCYDEPGIRAPIKLTIIHGSTYFAAANTPTLKKSPGPEGYTITEFQVTPPMQTYLLAFAVSDFSYVAVHSEVPQRVLARKSVVQNGGADFAVRAGVKILSYLDEYVHQSYGQNNPKMDQIGIPDAYFGAGAMENWGLVTYLESALYYNEKMDKFSQQQRVAGIISHEYAHQYFGNWVSPTWWSYLWLNEGFAQLYGSWLVSGTYPELSTDELYILGNFQSAATSDGLGTTRPMTHYVDTPEAISSLFDVIAYQKSSAVLRMISYIMTEPVWRQGLNYYLTEMENKAANSDDLARGLQKAADEAQLTIGASLKEIIDSWSLNAGVPVVTVSLDTTSNELKFSQKRFLTSNTTEPRFKNAEDVWLVPMTVATASKPRLNTTIPQFWLKTKDTSAKSGTNDLEWKTGDWVLVNVGATGYFRVHYDTPLLELLMNKLDSETFEEISQFGRTQIIDDALAFGKADTLDYVTILRLLKFLSRERNFMVWVTASNGLRYLNNLLSETEFYPWFLRYVQDLVTPLYKDVGIHDFGNTETLGEKRAREVAIEWACRTGVESCLKEATTRLEDVVYNRKHRIEPNLQGVLECAALRQVSTEFFLLVWTRMQALESGTEKNSLVSGLGCTQSSEQQQIYLNSTISTTPPPPVWTASERNAALRSVYENERNGLLNAIEFLLNNYESVKNLYPNNAIPIAIANMAGYVSSEVNSARYGELLTKARREDDLTDAQVTRYKEIAGMNLKWVESNSEEIEEYFKVLYSSSGKFTVSMLLVVAITLKSFFFN